VKAETLRIVADWLDSSSYAVNTLLASVPLDGTDDTPANVTVLNAADDPHAALDQVPTDTADLPALVVTLYTSPLEQVVPASQPWPPDAQVDVLIRYANRNATTTAGVRDESYTLRVIWRSLAKLMTTTEGVTARTRNSVQLYGLVSMRALTLDRPYQDAIMTGAVILSLRVRDLYAQGA
jgi:hypothetical protein